MATRVYQPVAIAIGQELMLNDSAAHHVAHVLRRNKQDELIIFNGQGGEFHGVITNLSKNKVSVLITDFIEKEVESPLTVQLAQVISRGEKMDFTLQKAVELGVSVITPLLSERCGVKLSPERWEKKQQHWQKIIASACEQCGRNTLPTLHPVIALGNWLETLSTEHTRLILHPENGNPLSQIHHQTDSVMILIGPEGGFSPLERQWAQHHKFLPVTLGPRILRTETAGLVALSLIQSYWGDLSI